MYPLGERRSAGRYFHEALRDEWDGLDKIYRDLRLADLVTLLNALMGLGALLLAGRYPRVAIELVLLGVILDGVDGAVARLGKGNGPLGGVLDSLADGLTFVTTSTVVAFLYLRAPLGLHGATLGYLAPFAFYMVCGILRLARFESMRDGKVRAYFSGIPTPAAAVTLLALVLLGAPNWLLLVAAPYLGVLMVSRVRFPKMRGSIAFVSVAVLASVLATYPLPTLQRTFTWVLLACMALYVVVGPFYVLARHGPGTES
ncbi:MAG: CDP-alcohol phosphatidyltransferase family protein [Thermoplasmatota archaeon]